MLGTILLNMGIPLGKNQNIAKNKIILCLFLCKCNIFDDRYVMLNIGKYKHYTTTFLLQKVSDQHKSDAS